MYSTVLVFLPLSCFAHVPGAARGAAFACFESAIRHLQIPLLSLGLSSTVMRVRLNPFVERSTSQSVVYFYSFLIRALLENFSLHHLLDRSPLHELTYSGFRFGDQT